MKKLTQRYYPGLLCGIIILILTGFPGSYLPHVNPSLGLDKIAHFFMFCGFTFFCLWGYRKPYGDKDKRQRCKALFTAFAIGIAYGALTEVLQKTVFYQRSGNVYDFFADLLGCFIGGMIFAIFFRKKNKNNNSVVL